MAVTRVGRDYEWRVGDDAEQWRIELEGPPETSMRLQLSAGDGERPELIDQASGPGLAALNDVRLKPGTWFINVVRQGADPVPFELRALLEPEHYDPEPNETVDTAVIIEDGDDIRGRLGRTDRDEDVYRLSVPPRRPPAARRHPRLG